MKSLSSQMVDKVMNTVSVSYGVEISRIRGRSKRRKYAEPRKICFYLLSKMGAGQEDVAEYFEVSQPNISLCLSSVEDKMDGDDGFRSQILNLLEVVK